MLIKDTFVGRNESSVCFCLFLFLLQDKRWRVTAWQLLITCGSHAWGMWRNDNKDKWVHGCLSSILVRIWVRVCLCVYLLWSITVNHVRHEGDLPVQEGGRSQVQGNLVCHHHCDVHSWRNLLNCPTWGSTGRERRTNKGRKYCSVMNTSMQRNTFPLSHRVKFTGMSRKGPAVAWALELGTTDQSVSGLIPSSFSPHVNAMW